MPQSIVLSVVVPVHNERDNLEPLIGEIRDALKDLGEYEIVVVDDGSEDGTADRLRELKARIPELRAILHRGRYGQSAAIHTGVKAAKGAWVATLDGDGQNDPADIHKLLAARDETGPGSRLKMIAGWRVDRKDPWSRRISSRIANGVRRRLLGDTTPDTGCGLKLFARDAFLDLPRFDHMHRFLPALMQRDGWEVRSIPVNHRPRYRGASDYGVRNRLWAGMVDLFGVAWFKRRARRPEIEEEL
jgi:dolichol-phosphate mannosyltransferase